MIKSNKDFGSSQAAPAAVSHATLALLIAAAVVFVTVMVLAANPGSRVAGNLDSVAMSNADTQHGAAPIDTASAEDIDRQPEEVMDRELTVTLSEAGSGKTVSVVLKVSEHPEWVTMHTSMLGGKELRVDAAMVQASLESGATLGIPMHKTAEILSTALDLKKVLRASTTGIATAGFDITSEFLASHIADAFADRLGSLSVTADYIEPTVTATMSGGAIETWTLLSTGLSDFSGSTVNRSSNVHKAIEERLNNIIVPAGAVFSVVDAMDAPITLQKGWKEDKGLFGGGAALTPGAGICQSATTMFRAALLAGLPLIEKRNHSLFVDHYEPFGVGLDATMFPGVHDFRFKNDTGHDILIQAYIHYPTVTVNIFGTDDGRTVEMDGPYFVGAKNRPKALQPLSNHQIGWVRKITFSDGRELIQPIVSTYAKPVWRFIVKKFEGANGMELMKSWDWEKKM